MKSHGQALFEYLIVLGFTVLILGRFLQSFGEFTGDSIGRFNATLSLHLMTGLCREDCFNGYYLNGRRID